LCAIAAAVAYFLLFGGAQTATAQENRPVSFINDVAPILQKNCQECHRPGQIGPMSLLTYDDASAHAPTIAEVVREGRMPPWYASREHGEFINRRRLLEFWRGYRMHQPSIFWRREVFDKVGPLREDLHLTMDFDYWVRVAQHYQFLNVDQVLSFCNQHPAAKTGDNCVKAHRVLREQRHSYWGSKWSLEYWSLEASLVKHLVAKPIAQKLRLI
jgi:hypothetical protein